MANINRVVLVGNLTKDPELSHTPSGTAVCKLRLAVNTRQKDGQTGEWGDKPNYFDVTVWGNQGESCAQFLAKGRPVAVDGRLDGASGRRRTAPSGRRSRSSPTRFSSSGAAATGKASRNTCLRQTSRPTSPT